MVVIEDQDNGVFELFEIVAENACCWPGAWQDRGALREQLELQPVPEDEDVSPTRPTFQSARRGRW